MRDSPRGSNRYSLWSSVRLKFHNLGPTPVQMDKLIQGAVQHESEMKQKRLQIDNLESVIGKKSPLPCLLFPQAGNGVLSRRAARPPPPVPLSSAPSFPFQASSATPPRPTRRRRTAWRATSAGWATPRGTPMRSWRRSRARPSSGRRPWPTWRLDWLRRRRSGRRTRPRRGRPGRGSWPAQRRVVLFPPSFGQLGGGGPHLALFLFFCAAAANSRDGSPPFPSL